MKMSPFRALGRQDAYWTFCSWPDRMGRWVAAASGWR